MDNHKGMLGTCKIPNHVAFIMDGNGRWAKARGKQRTFGHKAGANTLKQICHDAKDLGIKYVTVYAFSTENWKRPKDEVDYLMRLLKQFLKDSIKEAKKNQMKVTVIGDKSGLPADLRENVKELEACSSIYEGFHLQIALNYGGKDEIIRSIKDVFRDFSGNNKSIDELTEEDFSSYLDTKGIPDPDLMIRTSGELRLSNFMLWQLAYSEFYFTDVYWPDFNKDELIKAILDYNKVERRFGGIK